MPQPSGQGIRGNAPRLLTDELTTNRAGLFLRAHRLDPGLAQLRTAVARELAPLSGVRFSSLFFDARGAIDPVAVAAIRADIEGFLSPVAEVTWQGDLGPDDAVAALGTTRRSFTRMPTAHVERRSSLFVTSAMLAAGHAWLKGVRRLGFEHVSLADRYYHAGDVLEVARLLPSLGFWRYERMNWALPGHEAQWLVDSREGRPVMAIGPCAQGSWPTEAGRICWRTRGFAAFSASVAAGGSGHSGRRLQAGHERVGALLLGGLSMAAGLDVWAMDATTRAAFDALVRPDRIQRLVEQGRLRVAKGRMIATDFVEAGDLYCELQA